MTNKNYSTNFFHRHRVLSVILIILAIPLLFIIFLVLKPIDISTLRSSPNPASDYKDASSRFDAIAKDETKNTDLNPECYSNLLTHGEETEIAYVFYHGLTSCPSQFNVLGREFYNAGYNVLIPRLPGHGYADCDVKHLENLTAEELAAFADQTVDIAQGLGKKVIVAGLSGGGTVAAWIAQNRGDVEGAFLINPFFGVSQIPAFATKTAANFGLTVPNMNFYAKNSPLPDSSSSSSSSSSSMGGISYNGLATRGESQFLRLGLSVEKMAASKAPAVKKIGLLFLQNDPVVNDKETKKYVEKLLRYPELLLAGYMISDSRGLPHDIITPSSDKDKTDYVYSLVRKIIPSINEPGQQ